MQRSKQLFLLLLTLITLVGCDQATKQVAQTHLSMAEPRTYFNNMLRLEYAENSGAFLSLGNNLSDEMQFWVFTVFVSILLLALFAAMLNFLHKGEALLAFALALYLGGGIGNLIDRFLHDGHVIDFLNIGIGGIRTGIFNVADMAIMAGVGLLIVSGLRSKDVDTFAHERSDS